MLEPFYQSETSLHELFYNKFTSHPQMDCRVIYDMSLKIHFKLMGCYLPEHLFTKV